ncbi:MAG: YigZ family protein [Bifidobacteriaceae bacterium]|jgi:uncharacterized YigZ family protein|nr:YigZ family protein [Bifidobacteriaceae bacterium]
MTVLNTAAAPSRGDLVEKKSEFIGNAAHCSSEAEVLDFVESVRLAHPKARHVAFAAIFETVDGEVRQISERMSDDGEPSGTAGKPILDALQKSAMSDVAVTVTRYFGGILLGSAGLIRAYSTAASEALRAGKRARIVDHTRYAVTVEYPQLATFDHVLSRVGGSVEQRDYSDVVKSVVLVEAECDASFADSIREVFKGSVFLENEGGVAVPVPEN